MEKTPEEIRAEAVKAERDRVTAIRLIIDGVRERMPDIKIDENALLRDNCTIERANELVLKAVTEHMKPVGQRGTDDLSITADEADKFRAAVEDGLMLRCGAIIEKPAPGATDLRGYSLYDLAAECLERQGEKVRGRDKRAVADMALFGDGQRTVSLRTQGTSDFPLILANVANKVMRRAYEEVPTTYQQWVNFADAADFKEMSRPQFSESPDLDLIAEGGKYKVAEFSENTEKYKIQTYGKVFAVTRQTIINDDMNVISRVPALFGAAAARKVNALAYGILTTNAALADGTALFHTNHKNLAGTNAAVTVASLGAARAAMRVQKALAGKAVMNIVPKFIIIPAAIELAVMQVIRSAFDPSKTNNITYNPFTELTPVVDAVLDADSVTAWYLAASPSQIDTVEVAFLNGQRTPYQEQRVGFDVDGLEMKVRIDVAAKALDFRGLYKNAGA